jgi:hypothetical protein
MKALSLFTLVFMLTSFNVRNTKEMYYFCTSRSMTTGAEQGKETVLLTSVKMLVAEEAYTKNMAKAWGSLVDKQCSNAGGCTSDFNYYPDETSARKQFDKAKARYSDTSRYVIKLIEFKAK